MFVSSADYRDSLRRRRPRVHLDGDTIDPVADEPRLAPGILQATRDLAALPPQMLPLPAGREPEVVQLTRAKKSGS